MKRVLIADDEPHVVRLLTRALEGAGYDVESVCNGKQAFERVCESPPDILITDIEMPHMNGRELCLQIDEEIPDREFLTLVISSAASVDHRNWSRDMPNTMFVEKPISIKKLLSGLDGYFESFFEKPGDAGAKSSQS